MFFSILYPTREHAEYVRQTQAPNCFHDLNLDQIVTPILASRKDYALDSFYYTPLRDPDTVLYRQDVLRQFENERLREALAGFSQAIHDLDGQMSGIRRDLSEADSYHNNYLTRGRMLDCAERYCKAISQLLELSFPPLESEGLRSFFTYLSDYCRTEEFLILSSCVRELREDFSKVRYCMLIKDGTISVRKYEEQPDHSRQLLSCFEKFRQGEVKDYRQKMYEAPSAEHVEAAVLNMVAGYYKEEFGRLNHFCKNHLGFINDVILCFSREVQFYLAWLEYIRPLQCAGLPFCYPQICGGTEYLHTNGCFDLALAQLKKGEVVVNNFVLNRPELIIAVTGPNQGGKTTFARAFGQIHYLAALGLCVPGRDAALPLFDNILTHFEREEDLSTLNGKLQDDLVRLRALTERATSRSIIIVNEIFASTTLQDALELGKRMMEGFVQLGAVALIVTFLDELAVHGPETVSMMSTVHPDDPASRTFRIIRKPPDGLAYAIHIASKHGLTYEQLCRRLEK